MVQVFIFELQGWKLHFSASKPQITPRHMPSLGRFSQRQKRGYAISFVSISIVVSSQRYPTQPGQSGRVQWLTARETSTPSGLWRSLQATSNPPIPSIHQNTPRLAHNTGANSPDLARIWSRGSNLSLTNGADGDTPFTSILTDLL